MGCEVIGNTIFCSRPSWKYCQVKGCGRKQEALCDFPVGGRTCDFRLCYKHRKTVGPNKDYCPNHNLQRHEEAREHQ